MSLRLVPRSLFGRALAVLVAGVLAANGLGLLASSGGRPDLASNARGRQIARQIGALAAALEAAAPAERAWLIRSTRQPGLRLFLAPRASIEDATAGWQLRLIRSMLLAELEVADPERLRLSLTPPARAPEGHGGEDGQGRGPRRHPPGFGPPPGRPPPVLIEPLFGALRLADGSWLNFAVPRMTLLPFWATPLFVVALLSTLLVLATAVWAILRALRPLAMLSAAAERLGTDVHAAPLATDGPTEVRRAAIAFNRMQDRLAQFVRDRTQLLAAISHDLRTPITRLRLRAALIDDAEQQQKMLADLDEMQAMIEASLAFARSDAETERSARFDLAVLLQTVCDEQTDAGRNASYTGPAHATCSGRPMALKRAFRNLVDNAVAFGGRADVRLDAVCEGFVITVEDQGPGLPPDELERVFAPFYRAEPSRNRTTGGTGLGLAVVRAAVGAHGGQVTLSNRPSGGLCATVLLPQAPTTGIAL